MLLAIYFVSPFFCFYSQNTSEQQRKCILNNNSAEHVFDFCGTLTVSVLPRVARELTGIL